MYLFYSYLSVRIIMIGVVNSLKRILGLCTSQKFYSMTQILTILRTLHSLRTQCKNQHNTQMAKQRHRYVNITSNLCNKVTGNTDIVG